MADFEAVRWGVLSTADINRKWLTGLRETPLARAVAVGSRSLERGMAFAAEQSIPRAHGSYEGLLADPEVEAVYIPLPNLLHHEWTMKALAAGKHVLCEKPYSMRPADVTQAFDAADAAGLVLSEAFMWRHHPQVRVLRESLSALGELQTVRAAFAFAMDRDVDIRLDPALDGGALMDVGCYCVSGCRLVTGEEPDIVYGQQTLGPSGVDLVFSGLLHFPSGLTTQIFAAFTTDFRGLDVVGSKGTLRFIDPWQSKPATIVQDGVETTLEWSDPYKHEIEDFSGAVREHRPPLLGREDALGQARTIEALYRSARTGRPVKL